jgi:hypothetical protein
MDILRSHKEQLNCAAGAIIYSGVPDPDWQVEEEFFTGLENLWNSMPAYKGGLPDALPLGYKGCYIKCTGDTEFFAYNGVVTKRTLEGHEHRTDKERKFEKLLLDSAPEGLLPEKLF